MEEEEGGGRSGPKYGGEGEGVARHQELTPTRFDGGGEAGGSREGGGRWS